EKQHLVGKKAIIPFVNREVEIFADEHVDKEFGTGFVKATPAHDPNDFEMGQRHGLKQVIMLDQDARVLPVCQLVDGSDRQDELPVPEFLAGLDRFDARQKIVAALKKMGQLEKIEDYTHSVGHSYRSKAMIEPYLSEQWFVKMQPLAKPALEAVRSGKIKLCPEGRWEKTYEHWMTNVRDWCISRQLWWGHRIPVWYNDNGDIKVCAGDPSTPDEKWQQDSDVLDTWFSSQLWPFSTFGWPDKNADLDYFYPTNTLVTGPDIIFFWVARMIISSLEFMGDIPFRSVYFNGIIRDAQGRKMSKMLGNGIDPLEMIDRYSADAVRYSLLALSSEGQDINLAIKDFEIGRNFTNKLWNAFRFVAINLEEGITAKATMETIKELHEKELLDLADRWILSRYSETITRITNAMERFRFHEVNSALHSFFWSEFCDWYLELIKPRLSGDNAEQRQATQITAVFVLRGLLRLLHPIIPFITEEIWQKIGTELSDSVMISAWPDQEAIFADKETEARMELLQAAILAVRNIRGELNVPPQKYADVVISGADATTTRLLQANKPYFSQLARVSDMQIGEKIKRPKLSATSVVRNLEVFVPLAGLIDIEVEKSRLLKEKTRLEGQVASLQRKLQNQDFLSKAPKNVVENEQRKLHDFEQALVKIENNLAQLAE
ncbi:MAG: valine--tRNA ligase, partial [bacterium]